MAKREGRQVVGSPRQNATVLGLWNSYEARSFSSRKASPGLEPGPTLVDMVTTGFPNPVVTISTRVGPGSRYQVSGILLHYSL